MKTQRRLLALLCVLALLAALTGCGEKQKAAPAPTPAPAEQPAPAQPTQQETPAPAPTPAAPARPVVEDNGGQFVGVDGKVWFRLYGEGELDEPQIWGEFLKAWPTHGVKSTLCCYDASTGVVTEAMPDDGFGELWFGVDGFYLSRSTMTGTESYHKTLDGKETVLSDGTVLGVSDNGRFAATRRSDGAICVYRGTEEIGSYGEDGDFAEFCALTDDGALITYTYDYNAEEGRLLCADAASGASSVQLGLLPPLPEESTAYYWEFEQCLVDGGDVWCAFGSYEGTGHFLADTLCVRAKLNAENSLETVEDQPTAEYPVVPKLFKDADGEVCRGEYLPGEVQISYEDGSLLCFDKNGDLSVQIDAVMPDYYDDAELIVQTAEHIGDAAYVIAAKALRAPDDDIGWRMAYAPDGLRYLRVELGGEQKTEALDGLDWTPETTPSVEAILTGFVGTWALYATEVEGDRNDTLPEGTWETIEFRADGTALIMGSDYQNKFFHAEVLPTNGVDASASPYGLLITGGANDDMLWAYFEGDTLVATVMVHFEADGVTDSYSRTGFYMRSVG